MNRWLGLFIVAALLILGWIAYDRPDLFPGDVDVVQLIYLLMALLLVSGAGWGFRRIRIEGGRPLLWLLVWAAILGVIMLAYMVFN